MNLEKFSPNNLHTLDAEGVKELQNLSIEQIGELAEKYNTPNNYLAVVNDANHTKVVTPATYKSIISAHEKGFTKLKIVDTLANYKVNASYEVSIQEPKPAVIDLGKIEPLVQKSIEVEDVPFVDNSDTFKTELEVLIEEAEKELEEAIEVKKSKKVIAELKKNVADLHDKNTQP